MIIFAENSLPKTSKDIIYYGYYQFFLNLYGLFLDRIKNKPKEISKLKPKDLNDEFVCRAIAAINSIEQEDISFGLYYSDIELISIFRVKKDGSILHIPEIIFLSNLSLEEKMPIISEIIGKMQSYAEANEFERLEFEVPKNDIAIINSLLTYGFQYIPEHPQTTAQFQTLVLYMDILKKDNERANSSKQRKRENQ